MIDFVVDGVDWGTEPRVTMVAEIRRLSAEASRLAVRLGQEQVESARLRAELELRDYAIGEQGDAIADLHDEVARLKSEGRDAWASTK